MLIGQAKGITRSFGAEETNDYVVANSVVIMNLLSKSLYKDQIKAPIRELSTNSWDAHVASGNVSKPFDVWLPTRSEPTFKIRDYGTGLSKEAMVKLYRIYGASDKSESNEFNGCMGIGSKSPFAYTNMFTSTSYFEGMKYVYVNSKDEYGRPKMQLMVEEATSETNGFEIEFSVKPNDIATFEERSHELYEWFPVMPTIHRGRKCTQKTRNIILQGEDWCIDSNINECVAVMGYIAYPIEPKYFSDKKDVSDDRWYQRYGDSSPYVAMLNSGIVLQFAIGDIEMDASREGLQYTRKTIDAIKEKLDEIRKEINIKVETELKTSKNYWDACCFYQEVVHSKFSAFVKILNSGTIKYDGKAMVNFVEVGDNAFLKFWLAGRASVHRRQENGIQVNKKTRIYINDVKIGSYAAIYRELEKDNQLLPYLFHGDTKALATLMGCDESSFIKISSLPKPPKGARNVCKDKVFTYKYGSSRKYHAFNNAEIDFEDGGYFVELNNNHVLLNGRSIHFSDINNLIDFAKENGYMEKDDQIYAVKTVSLNKFTKAKTIWSNFFDVMKESIQDYISKNNIGERIAQINVIDNLSWKTKQFCCTVESGKFGPLHKLGKFTGIHKDYQKIHDKYKNALDNLYTCAIMVGVELQANITGIVDLEKECQRLVSEYPLIKCIDGGSYNKEIVEYIKLVDKCETL